MRDGKPRYYGIEDPRTGARARKLVIPIKEAHVRDMEVTATRLGIPFKQMMGLLSQRNEMYAVLYGGIQRAIKAIEHSARIAAKTGAYDLSKHSLPNIRQNFVLYLIHGSAFNGSWGNPPGDFTLDYFLQHRESDLAIEELGLANCGSWPELERRFFAPGGGRDYAIGALLGWKNRNWYASLAAPEQWTARVLAFSKVEPELKEQGREVVKQERTGRMDHRFKLRDI